MDILNILKLLTQADTMNGLSIIGYLILGTLILIWYIHEKAKK